MAKLAVEDFKEYEDGDYTVDGQPHWITIRKPRRGEYSAHVVSSDWRDDYTERGSTVDFADGFDTLEEALAWGVDVINDIPLRLACAALETAFGMLSEWLPFVALFVATAERERDEARAELASMRADLAALTERMEAEIPAACAAARERTIAQCVAFAVATEVGLAMRGEVGRMHVGAHDVVLTLRALAAPQPAPTEPADVDPEASAYR